MTPAGTCDVERRLRERADSRRAPQRAMLRIEGLSSEPVATRAVPDSFEEFAREALIVAAEPAEGESGPNCRLDVADDFATRDRFQTADRLAVRFELRRWVVGLHGLAYGEGRLVESLLQPGANECAYWLAPLDVPLARPVILVRLHVLEQHGTLAVLGAIWERERDAQAGEALDKGSLFDQLIERSRN